VAFYNERVEWKGDHSLRLPKNSSVGFVLEELKKVLGEEYAEKRFRLMEVHNNKVWM
jgi:hypothetical protein